MDLQPINSQDPTSSSLPTSAPLLDQDSSTLSTDSKALRTSARVKAAKQKPKGISKAKERDFPSHQALPPSQQETPAESSSRTTRATNNNKSRRGKETSTLKGKPQDSSDDVIPRTSKRARRTTNSLTINEPIRDPKGKKRAIPDPGTDEEETAGPSSKRPRTSYSLRSTTSTQNQEMPRKTRSSIVKEKMTSKAKAAVASSSRVEDEDIEMLDGDYRDEVAESTRKADLSEAKSEEVIEAPMEQQQEQDGDDVGDDDSPDEGDDEDREPPIRTGESAPTSAPLDEPSAMSIFGDFRQFGSYMMSLSSRLKTMLTNIKSTADPTTRLITLQELSELLSISTEDTLAGSFQVEQFVKELVKILGGRGNDEDEDDDGDDDGHEHDEDAALAAALAMSTGGSFQGDENLEAQVLACRCLANLMEALPGVAHTVVYHGAIPVLCSKLIEISYIDLAEQTLSTMEKISEEFPSAIVREGGLAALLNYLDFFSIAVQRTALQAASNCCRNVSSEHFPMIKAVWPIIRNCLSYSDQRLVEFACLCVIRTVDSYHRGSPENLESLMDAEMIRAINQLLLPAGGSPLIAGNTYTLLLRALATSARASPKIAIALLEADIVDTLYQILTGVLPSSEDGGSEVQSSAQGLGGSLADMTVMDNLAHRPKDQVEEALSLTSELMPPLPKDGVFDHKGYTEKSLSRLIKAKAKTDRAAARQAAHSGSQSQPVAGPALVEETPTDSGPTEPPTQEGEEATSSAPVKEPAPDRIELLRSKSVVVGRYMQLMVPILIDVYAASVITPVRIKTLTGLLKAISFLDADGLKRVLTYVPVASFASSILSSRDHPSLVIGALQLVDLLLAKVPQLYKPTFRREGVFHEIEGLGERPLASTKSKEKAKPDNGKEKTDEKERGDDSEKDKASDKEKDKDVSSETPTPEPGSAPPPVQPPVIPSSIPGFKKLSSLSLEPEDAITLRARVIRFKYLMGDVDAERDTDFENLQKLVEKISSPSCPEKELAESLRELASLFASPNTSVSSFELLQSGVVDGLLQLATEEGRTVDVKRRKELLQDALTGRKIKGLSSNQTPFATFVKKLQESLTRMESFDVITVAQNSDDSKRSSPSLLARQLRLRLVAGEGSDVPRNLHNIVVSIHAIATFQALHDYLRPRVAGLLGGGSRLSGMLAALAASGFGGSSSRLGIDDLRPPPRLPAATSEAVEPTTAQASLGRRRSQRLSAKNSGAAADESTNTAEGPSTSTPATNLGLGDMSLSDLAAGILANAEAAPSDTVVDSELQADFSDDEIDAEVFDDDMAADHSVADKTVNLSIVEDGDKIEAQTPEGTRVATPSSSNKDIASSISRAMMSSKSSYAAALKAKPTDWHLEFSMDDQPLPLDLTIYGAIHQHEMRKKTGAVPPSMIWQGVYTIKFKKVPGPLPTSDSRSEGAEMGTRSRSSSPILSSLPEDAPSAKILKLLRVLNQLNTIEGERPVFAGEKRHLADVAFVNNKLTAKLTRQLEEPMIVASSCLPDWALDLPQHFPFLFPFATRYNFLQSTSFGYARLILKWQSQQPRAQDNNRRDEGIGFLGRLQRQKVRISRKHILESAVKVFELYGSSSSVLEVEYFEEVGTGLGPTLEFYSLVSREFARKDLKIWRDDANSEGPYVHHPTGLFPAPLSPEDIANDGGQKRTHILRIIGQFVAKAMLDSRIIDLSFNKIFIKLILGEEVPLTIATLKLVDLDLANSLVKLQNIALGRMNPPTDKLSRKIALVESVSIEDLALDFTLPGYDIELRPGGRDVHVTSQNVDEYIAEILDAILGKGTRVQAQAFRDGFSKVFPIADLQAFSADELVMLFGNSDEDWSTETLAEALKADHGFNVESKAIRDLLEIMSSYDASTRRDYLQFITGSPKLPIGGFRGLNPPLTVVRKPHEAPLTADDYLPSVMTCVNYLKLPEYSSKEVMREKLRIAIQEGVGSFHLS